MPMSLSRFRPAITCTSNNPLGGCASWDDQIVLGTKRAQNETPSAVRQQKSQGRGSQQSRTALGAGGSSLRLQLWQPTRSPWQVAIYWLAVVARPQFSELKHKLGSDKAQLQAMHHVDRQPLLWLCNPCHTSMPLIIIPTCSLTPPLPTPHERLVGAFGGSALSVTS